MNHDEKAGTLSVMMREVYQQQHQKKVFLSIHPSIHSFHTY